MRILVAEDDPNLAEGLMRSLRQAGYAVDCARSGNEADAALEANEFDLLILDIGLPEKSGLQVLKAIVKKLSVAETSPVMTEEIVWRGTSSQWKNFGFYLLCGLLCWLIVPIFFALARYLQTKCKIFEVTTQRFKTTSGIFSKVTETLELYRVKDIETRQPFLCRMVGVENVQMNTSDASSPFVFIEAVPSSVGLADKIRNQVEIIRQQKRVREIDIE